MEIANKHIAVLGLGESGEAAAALLAEGGAMVAVLDSADAQALEPRMSRLRKLGVRLVEGRASETDATRYDLGVLSPGIDPASPLVRNFVAKRIEMIGELEFAWHLCKCPVIAITGSNGKTTTTSLVAEILNACGKRTVAAGNISPAFSAVVKQSGELDVMTLEVSSFQLEEIRSFRPHIAAWLNLSPNHLDRYPSMDEYRAAKLRIFENQTPEDFAVVNLRESLPPLAAKTITFSAYASGGDFDLRAGVIYFQNCPVFNMAEAQLKGLHNAENIMAALAVGHVEGLRFEDMAPAVRAFRAPPHRCELVCILDGVRWINDSKSTSLEATEKALLAEEHPVILIAGGKDKGFEFDPLAPLVAKKCRHAVLIGQMASRIAQSWVGTSCHLASDLQDAIRAARNLAQAGDVVLFSPATSSFDMFKNYIDRGDQFRSAVQQLSPNNP